ncbi:MAG: ATP-binding protein, partial [Actinomycetales bacterium]
IDRLENDETDPDQLAQLFRLDHLAARMRRNNDNLMVLAGSDASRGAGRALRVVDVVRAAVSETEQYERVTVRAAPHVTVAAATSHDLVHLLAELLDNATVFSAPDTTVTVDVQGGAGEGMRIEVTDRGLGIPAEDLDQLNAKLTEPPVVDAGVPRQMGLFVVAHLARRHGIRVNLQPGVGGRGTEAIVHVPPAVLVAPDGEVPRTDVPAPGTWSAAVAASAPAAPAETLPAPVLPAPVLPMPVQPAPVLPAEPRVPVSGPAVPDAEPRVDDTRPQPSVAAVPVAATDETPPVTPAPYAANGAVRVGHGQAENEADPLTGPIERVRPTEPNDAADQHTDPWELPSEEETPIFRELSAWFRASTPGTGTVRAPEPVNGTPRPVRPAEPAASGGGEAGSPTESESIVHRIPTTPVAAEPVAVPSVAFASAADEGWLAAAAAEANQPTDLTPAGLPRRRPMAQLVPGSAPASAAVPAAPVAPSRRPRDADAVRGRLANYQRGLQSGRNRVRTSPDGSAPSPSDTDLDQSDQRRYAP